MYWGGLSAAANAAAAYQTGQTGYAVSHTPAAGTYPAQRAPSSFDASYQTATSHASASYPTASTTYDYGYTARPTNQPTAAAAAAAAVYDTSKTYYGQPAAAAAAAAAATAATPYTATDTHYQNIAGGTLRQTSSTAATPKTSYASAYSASTASQSAYNNTGYTAQTSSTNKGSGTGLYMQPSVQSVSGKTQGNTWQTMKKTGPMNNTNKYHHKSKAAPKPQQLHYCDVCKISCAGPQTYREHLEGQKHKKKEASAKAGVVPPRVGASLRCELCDVTCTGTDAYAAHIRGAKHQKVVKLHIKLGKPIPSDDPVVVGSSGTSSTSGTTTNSTSAGKTTTTGAGTSSSSGIKKEGNTSSSSVDKDDMLELKEKEVEPVGQEYIEEIKGTEGDSQGKVISFNCKLCDCRFNDPNAKEMHMKGRRHRLQFKKKVNPDLQVEVKPSMRMRKLHEEKLRRQQMREEVWRRREEERLMDVADDPRWLWDDRRRLEDDEYDWYNRRFPRVGPPPGLCGPPMMGSPHPPPMRPMFMPNMPHMMRRPDSSDDRHVMAKHSDIYPPEEELSGIQKIVSITEKALKLVSDYLAELDAPKDAKVKEEKKKEPVATIAAATPTKEVKKEVSSVCSTGSFSDKKDDTPARVLKGVMRVGILAKGLLLRGDNRVELVVLCGEKPTRTLLDRVADSLPEYLSTASSGEKYEVQRVVEDAALHVIHETYTVVVTLTAPVMREQLLQQETTEIAGVKDAPDVLDKNKCLEALAALRHAKWFQARANGLQSCVMIIRIMRDLGQRVPVYNYFSNWALELLCEKVVASSCQPLSPGDCLRRIFEAMASGLLLPGSPGLLDPCEKDPVDAVGNLTNQEREEITYASQQALRLIAFRRVHEVLGMEPLPQPKFQKGGRFTRKRRRDNSTGEGGESGTEQNGGEGKKDKKEDCEAVMETEKSK